MSTKKIDVDKLKGTAFQKKVWVGLLQIPKGKTVTYKDLAKKIGKPKAVRAVANAVGANPCPALYPNKHSLGRAMIPCHRVIRTDGSLGGYSGKGGIKTKLALLKKEGVKI